MNMWRSLCSVDTCTIIYGVSIYSAKSAESKKTTNDHTYTHYVELGNKKHTSCSISEIATKTALILMQASGTLPSEKELSCRLLWCIFLIDPTFSRWEGALTMKKRNGDENPTRSSLRSIREEPCPQQTETL